MSNIKFYQLAEELGYMFETLRSVYNRARRDEPEAKNLPSIGQDEDVPNEAETFIRKRFGGKGDKPKRTTVLEMPKVTPSVNTTELDKIKRAYEAKQAAYDGLQIDFNNKSNKLTKVEADLADAQELIKKLTEQFADVQTDLRIKNAESSSATKSVESVRTDYDKAKQTAQEATAKLIEATTAIGDYKAQLAAKTGECATAQKELDKALKLVETYKASVDTTGLKSESQSAILVEQLATIDGLKSELSSCQSELSEAYLKQAEYIDTIKELTATLAKVAWKLQIPTRLDLINYTEMGMATYGLFFMYSWLGLGIAVFVNNFYYDSMQVLKNTKAWKSANLALFLTFIIAVGFGFVHFNTFKEAGGVNNYDKWWTSVLIAVTFSGLSFMSLWQSSNKTNEL